MLTTTVARTCVWLMLTDNASSEASRLLGSLSGTLSKLQIALKAALNG